MKKTRYALVGASGRAQDVFADPIVKRFSDTAELVALCDPSQVHMDYYNQKWDKPVATYHDFETMVREKQFDVLLVGTQDSFHHEYIIKGLHAGKDVITEKPMTVDDAKCRAILQAEKETGHKVTVTFNVRYMPAMTAIYKVLRSGIIGDLVTMDMQWCLDMIHGASYFRRWHRKRANSGGLQVHKSTHHFDMANWFFQDRPETISARGSLAFYGKNGPYRSKRCLGCPHREECMFYFDINQSEYHQKFFLAAEGETGYVRDGCVFDEEIDIEDNFSLLVTYRTGVRLTYSLRAWAPWEGMKLDVQGTKGALKYFKATSEYDWVDADTGKIVIIQNDGTRTQQTPPKPIGTHAGGDNGMLPRLFGPSRPDPLNQHATSLDAAYSLLMGVATTYSIQKGGDVVHIEDLLRG